MGLAYARSMHPPPRMRVCLLHADDVSKDLIEASRSAIQRWDIFEVSKTVCLPRSELSKSTTPSSISEYGQRLAALNDPDCKIILALIAGGLIGPRDTPIFGAALRGSNSCPDVAVVSVRNLDPTDRGCPDKALLATRVQKEVIHELGHILGLNHCPSYVCVMRLSRNISEIDVKPPTYCPMCLLRLAVMPSAIQKLHRALSDLNKRAFRDDSENPDRPG
jgi:predicted Zn-dependent protease